MLYRLPRHLLILFSVLISVSSVAQSPARKPDKIYKTDQTIMDVLIEEINKTEIAYKKVEDPKGPLYAVPRKDVWKIVWNHGEVEEINPPVAAGAKPRKLTDLIVTKNKVEGNFWDKSGIYVGGRISAGLSVLSQSSELLAGSELAYSGGIGLGYHKKALGIQLQALYTQVGYGVSVPLGSTGAVTSIQGTQSQLLLPITLTASKKAGAIRIGASLGAFGVLQVGRGGLKVSDANGSATVKNCAACSDKGLGVGVTGGLGVTVFEGPAHAVFINADWYQNLGDNKNYKRGETSVHTHVGLLSAGVLFHLPNKH